MTKYEDNGNGILYTEGYVQFYSASFATHVDFDDRCTEIRGESPFSYAFKDSATTLKSFTFTSNSQLTTIQQYSFYNCVNLQEANLSMCSQLKTIGEYAFYGCTSMRSISFPTSLELLDNYSFYASTSLTTVSLPSSLKTIGRACFHYSQITSVHFDPNIRIDTIPWRSFAGTRLTEFEIPANVTSFVPSALEVTYLNTISVAEGNTAYKMIDGFVVNMAGSEVYYYPANSSSAKIPGGIKTIFSSAFTFCLIKTLELPSGLQIIKDYAFSININVQTLKIPNTVTSIENNAFYGCNSLYSVEFEATSQLPSLEGSLFYECSNLTSITIPASVQHIGTTCFYQCKKLENVNILGDILTISGGAFTGCSESININLTSNSKYTINENLLLQKGDQAYLISILNNPEEVIIPRNVINIGQFAFAYKNRIKTIQFEANSILNIIQNSAFSRCTSLETIDLPSTLTTVGLYTFENCTSLKTINMPNVGKIDYATFQYCTNLTEITFNALTEIVDYAFYSCEKLSKVSFYSSPLSSIGQYSFANTISLDSLDFRIQLTTIKSMAFYNSSITTITFAADSQLNTLEDSAFYYATKLTTINNLPQTITSIGTECFAYTSLTSFIVPSQTTSIGDRCFAYCSSLTNITIPQGCQLTDEGMGNEIGRGCSSLSTITVLNNNFTVENYALFNKAKNRLFLFPPASPTKVFALSEKVEVISMGAFYGCKNLLHILIPENGSLNNIGQNAFAECSNLRIINLPKTITTINPYAFNGCKNIQCGQIVDINETLIPSLLSAGFPKRALSHQCINTCKNNMEVNTHYIMFVVIFLSTSMN